MLLIYIYKYIFIYIYTHTHTHTYVYIYIYIYILRRERRPGYSSVANCVRSGTRLTPWIPRLVTMKD
jgi:hypothetical protein